MPNSLNKLISGFIVLVIVSMGLFREFLLNQLYVVARGMLSTLDYTFIEDFLISYGSTKETTMWVAHYILYYPLYLACHFLLIHFLFNKEPNVKYLIMKGLLIILVFLISGKIIFGIISSPLLEEYFSFAFHKLIGLPFLLLAIEGGRYFYKIIFFEKDQ